MGVFVQNGFAVIELRILFALGGCAFYYQDVSDNAVFGTDEINMSEMEYYIHDMMLLENQLPMLVLVKLFLVDNDNSNVIELILKFLSLLGAPVQRKEDMGRTEDEHLHVLDLNRTTQTGVDFNIPSATELHQAGIGFTTSKTRSLLDISFGLRTLKLPQISLDKLSKSSFLNIIAFEQFHRGAGIEFTSYIHFMRALLEDSNDVSLLQSRGIIRTTLRRREVARLFYRLRRDTMIDPDKMLAYEYWTVARRLRLSLNKMSNEWRRDLLPNLSQKSLGYYFCHSCNSHFHPHHNSDCVLCFELRPPEISALVKTAVAAAVITVLRCFPS
ncbi:hypothetical protein Salat_1558100 [Sesamum alatum]|uniref:Uncharacterized protein n=1 Tax=Sesamum alatum TaxID=300844 RepID=A0AAE1YDL7_9LAMI|nr:hypothetical protein Salat_1558100 [Sesamum alatum]